MAEGAGKDKGEVGSQQDLDRIEKGAWRRRGRRGRSWGRER